MNNRNGSIGRLTNRPPRAFSEDRDPFLGLRLLRKKKESLLTHVVTRKSDLGTRSLYSCLLPQVSTCYGSALQLGASCALSDSIPLPLSLLLALFPFLALTTPNLERKLLVTILHSS